MISLINELPPLSFNDAFLMPKIEANLLSYGNCNSFLFLWCQKADELITAIICRFEQSVIIVADRCADFDEIKEFLNAVGFNCLQADPFVFEKLGLSFTEYQVVCKKADLGGSLPKMPDIKKVYEILYGEENAHITKTDFDAFYVDLCHRIRHGTATAILDEASVCVASHLTESAAIISGILTKKTYQKKGLGSKALSSLLSSMNGRKVFAAAEKSVIPFYIKNGFEPCGKTAIFYSED